LSLFTIAEKIKNNNENKESNNEKVDIRLKMAKIPIDKD
jgi:hypothetical protein